MEAKELRTRMRTLWEDNVELTRKLIASFGENQECTESVIAEMQKNKDDIGDALKPYLEKYLFCWEDIPGSDKETFKQFLIKNFGSNWINNAGITMADGGKTIRIFSNTNTMPIRLSDDRTQAVMELDIGTKVLKYGFAVKEENGRLLLYQDNTESRNLLVSMLKNGVTISKNYLQAKASGDIGMALEADEAMKDNATSIAAYLSNFNPNWSHKSIESLLLEYIGLLKEVTIAYMNNADVSYEKIHAQAIKIADVLVDGIAS